VGQWPTMIEFLCLNFRISHEYLKVSCEISLVVWLLLCSLKQQEALNNFGNAISLIELLSRIPGEIDIQHRIVCEAEHKPLHVPGAIQETLDGVISIHWNRDRVAIGVDILSEPPSFFLNNRAGEGLVVPVYGDEMDFRSGQRILSQTFDYCL